MLTIDYQISSRQDIGASGINLSEADEVTLRYRVLLGDLILNIDGKELGTNFGWVPVIDFVVCLTQVVSELSRDTSSEAALDFTESDAFLRFSRRNNDVTIAPSYSAASGKVTFAEFDEQARKFVSRFRKEIVNEYPALGHNKTFAKLIAE